MTIENDLSTIRTQLSQAIRTIDELLKNLTGRPTKAPSSHPNEEAYTKPPGHLGSEDEYHRTVFIKKPLD